MPKKKSFHKKNSLLTTIVDNEELMQLTRKLIKEKEALEETLHSCNEECDLMLSLLCSSSFEERNSILSEFLPLRFARKKPSIFDKENFQSFIAARNLNVITKFLGVKARQSDNGEIIVEFMPPENYIPPSPVFITFEISEGAIKLKGKILPPSVPVLKLETDYLSEENYDISAFVFIIQKFIWAFWMRDKDVKIVKNAPYMNESIIYHNTTRTLITFTLSLANEYKLEICMKFEPLFILPYDITYSEFNDKRLTTDIKMRLNDLRKDLLIQPLSIILKDMYTSNSFRSDSSSKNSNDSEDTVAFEVFN